MKSLYINISAILILTAAILWVPDSVKAAVNCSDPGVICKSGTMAADETWTSGNIYVITGGDLTVPAGIALTIQAGTIVKFDLDRDLIVDGTLTANGTEGNIVYFTSVRDDTLGGDTDHDTTLPSSGNWDRIYYRDNSSGSLTYVEFRYGGENSYYNHWGMLHTDAASVTVDHGVFKNGAQCAINSHPAYEATLTNMSIADLTGNLYNGLCLRGGTLNQNAVWDETEVAYVLLSDLTLASAQALTWTAGIIIKPVGSSTQIIVDGALNANGTSTNPVYVTSLHDDTLGGNTDNQTATPTAGNWHRIYFRTGSTGTLTYIHLWYGGNAAIYISESSPSIRNCALQKNVIGIRVTGFTANPTIKECTIFENQQYGVYNDKSGHWIDATNNWWGSNSGPYDPSSSGTDGDYNDAGSGDRVNDYVLYRPWLRIDFEIFLPLTLR